MSISWLAACATSPEIYSPPDPHYVEKQMAYTGPGPQFERGRPNALVDGLNHYVFSVPTKLLLWNWQALDHKLPPENERLLRYYLVVNGLRAVKFRHNQYAPLQEFRRLRANSEVAWPYRYTLGLITWLHYTLFPDRLVAGLPIVGGGDHFNPFTNTVNVYSGDLGILLHEGGHAKDYLEHDSKGTSFALARLLPGVDLLQEARASTDAIRFLQCIRNRNQELRAYRTLIPAYSTYIAGYFEGGLAVYLPIVATGHVSGRLQARAREGAYESPELDALGMTREDYLPEFCRSLDAQDAESIREIEVPKQ